MRYYEFEIVKDRKIIKVKLWGFWNSRIAEDYCKDFEIAVYPLINDKWVRIVDVNEYKPSSEKVIKLLDDQIKWSKEKNMVYNANILGDLFERLQLKSKLAENNEASINLVFGSDEEALKWFDDHGF